MSLRGVKEGAHGGTMGSPGLDTTVFSRVLYQLSYLAARSKCSRGS
jgi:hypothetical protein